jgi:hypothetical protein
MNKQIPIVCTECKRIVRYVTGFELTREKLGKRPVNSSGAFEQWGCKTCKNNQRINGN